MKFVSVLCLQLFLCLPTKLLAKVGKDDLNKVSEEQYAVKINKCCEVDEIKVGYVGSCLLAKEYNQSVWVPEFKTEDGKDVKLQHFHFVPGVPNCETTQQTPIYDLGNPEDQLNLLFDGRLRHIISVHSGTGRTIKDPVTPKGLHESIPISEVEEKSFIHVQDKYCMDKVFFQETNTTALYALVCVPKVDITNLSFLMRKIINPMFHGISMVLFLIVAIIYFVLPTLRDLAGNIITTINMCLIVTQAANLVRIFTEFSNHISFMVTDITLYVSVLGAFFWLNSFGFYIWKTFKSRNVFLRVTDVRKYCYYSSVVWSCVAMMAAMAICAHFLLDTGISPNQKMRTQYTLSSTVNDKEQETIGWLGIAIFFTPIAFTIVFNLYFYVTTINVIKRINIYGRIHYKLKGCFDLFMQLFLIMTTTWLFLLLSWVNEGLLYAYIVINMLQSILIFYVCVIRQSHVTFLLRKSCCYAEPVPTGDWGDEMTQMNGFH